MSIINNNDHHQFSTIFEALSDNPVILIGVGRTGSSIIYEAFAQHPDFAFFSQYCERIPCLPQLTFIHRFFKRNREEIQLKKQSLFEKIRPKPEEAYSVWEYLCGKKFSNSFLDNISASPKERKTTVSYIDRIIKWQGKRRFITKITGPPRIEYLSSIFCNPVYIDIVRDPRAVVNSVLNVEFRIRKGFNCPAWIDTLDENDNEEWMSYHKSPLSLIALECRAVYKQTQYELNKVKPNYLCVKYEDYIDSPRKAIADVLDSINVTMDNKITDYLSKQYYENTNYKYMDKFTKEEINIIEKVCSEQMENFGYV